LFLCLQQVSFTAGSSVGQKIGELLSGTNGVLMAALVATFGIYLFASLLYVSTILCVWGVLLNAWLVSSVTRGTCSPASRNTCSWLPASPMSSTLMRSATCGSH
jgi:hypothetical protein